MFIYHIALALSLIALVAGTFLHAWAKMNGEKCKMCFAKLVGMLVVIASVISILCSTYCEMKFMQERQMYTTMRGMATPPPGMMSAPVTVPVLSVQHK